MQAAYLAWLAHGRDRWPTFRVLFAMLAGGGPFQLERLARRGVDVRSALDPNVFFDVSTHGRRAIEALHRDVRRGAARVRERHARHRPEADTGCRPRFRRCCEACSPVGHTVSPTELTASPTSASSPRGCAPGSPLTPISTAPRCPGCAPSWSPRTICGDRSSTTTRTRVSTSSSTATRTSTSGSSAGSTGRTRLPRPRPLVRRRVRVRGNPARGLVSRRRGRLGARADDGARAGWTVRLRRLGHPRRAASGARRSRDVHPPVLDPHSGAWATTSRVHAECGGWE